MMNPSGFTIEFYKLQVGFTAIYVAALKGHMEIIKSLIHAGADLNLQDIVSEIIVSLCPEVDFICFDIYIY